MIATRNEYFDSEGLSRMRAALDEAWRAVPASQQNPEIRTILAKAILHLAAEGELEPAELSRRALATIVNGARYDFEVLNGDETIEMVRSVNEGPSALWPRIISLAKIHKPGCRIRATDQTGAMVILVGVATARRLEGVGLNGGN